MKTNHLSTLLIALTLIVIPSLYSEQAAAPEEKPAETLLQIMARQMLMNYSVSDPDKDSEDGQVSIGFDAVEEHRKQSESNHLAFDMPNLSAYEKHFSLLNLFLHEEEESKTGKVPAILTPQSINDLDLYYYSADHPHFTLVESLYKGKSIFGKIAFAKMLGSPTTDTNKLLQRQELIRWLVKNPALISRLDLLFEAMKKNEMLLLSLFNPKDKLYSDQIKNTAYNGQFDLYKEKSWTTFFGIPVSSAVSIDLFRVLQDYMPVAIFLYSNLVARLSTMGRANEAGVREFRLGYTVLLGILLSAAAFKPTVDGIKNRKNTAEHIRERMKTLSHFGDDLRKVYSVIRSHRVLHELLPSTKFISEFNSDVNSDRARFLSTLKSSSFKVNPGYFNYFTSRIGPALYALPLFVRLQKDFVPLLKGLGELEAAVSIAKLMQSTEETKAVYSYPTYIEDADKPQINLTDYWHPMIDPSLVVRNSVNMGDTYKDMVLTGPNTGGKSTAGRSIALAVLLGQTIGIVPAAEMSFTPFSQINTSLKAVDQIGEGKSLFYAELERGHNLIERLKTLGEKEFALNIMDEIFSGTAPTQGEASSFSLAHALGMVPNAMTLIATHFPKLTTLPRHTNGAFKNFKVVAIKHPDHTVDLPYLLEEGRSTQTIVLELLRRDGFPLSLIERAANFMRAEHPDYDKLD